MIKNILVTGATGKQGGSLIKALLESPQFSPQAYNIFAVTRNVNSPSAQRLAARSPAIKLIKGDLKDASAIFRSLPASPWGVYAMTNPGKNEAAEGIALVDEAVKAGSSHFVFSSVDRGAADEGNTPTNVPHFITKHNVEARLRQAAEQSDGKLTYTIIRPPFFIDNLEWGFIGKVTGNIWRDHVKDKPLVFVATQDIGWWAATSFLEHQAQTYRNKSINIAGDRMTFDEANKLFESKTGGPIPTTYGFLASVLLFLSKDFRLMTEFFKDPGFGSSPEATRTIHPMTDFSSWIDQSSFAKKSN